MDQNAFAEFDHKPGPKINDMKNEEASLLLNQLILEKEAEHEAEGRLLKEDLRRVAESLRPVNIIKNTFKDLVSAPGIGTSLADSAIGLSAGFIAKKVFVGSSDNLFKKLAGFAVEMIVA